MAEPRGPPRHLHRTHTIKLSPDLEEELDRAMDLLPAHEAAGVAKAYLSSNAGAIIATFGAISAMLAFPLTQKLAAQYISFWRHQITSIFVDVATGGIPSPEQITEGIIGASEKIAETAKEVFDRITREFEATKEVEFGAAGPVGIPVDPALAERLRKEGVQPPQ